jgi:hypothetical protein
MRIALLAVTMAAALAASAAAQTPAPQTPATQAPAAPAAFACPDRITVDETPVAPPGTRPAAGRSERRFLGIDFFQGEYGDRSGSLASDADRRGNLLVQTTVFDAPRARPIYARCSYRDTEAAIYVDVPSGLSRCMLTFAVNRRTGAVGRTQTPQRIDCR